jgi:hypothetical protein
MAWVGASGTKLARTKETANLSADSQKSLPQVSSTAGRDPGEKLIPSLVDENLS